MAASLPHAYPFRFVDTILEAPGPSTSVSPAPGVSPWQGRVLTRISADGRAAMGEGWRSPLLLAEAIAQAALMLEGGDSEDGRHGFLAGIDGFEVARLPRSGESLSISVRLSARFGAIVKFDGEIRSGEDTLARGSVLVKRGDR